MIADWRWITKDEIIEIHSMQIDRYGGLSGIRDEGLLESALARPVNLANYEEIDDPVRLAAAYAFGIARNHPFTDGNKRTAFVAAALFLRISGMRIRTSQRDVIDTVLALAAGTLSETEFADWLRTNTASKNNPTQGEEE